MNPAANGTVGPNGVFECGAWTNQNFGKLAPATTYDPNVLAGWNVHEFSWDLGASIQQQLAPRVSVNVGYVRRTWGNLTVTDNRAVTATDFDKFTVTAPNDSRLPGGGNYGVTVFDVQSTKFGQTDNLVTFAKNYGDQTERYNGVDVNVDARLFHGIMVVGGLTTGRKSTNNCDIITKLPEATLGAASAGGVLQSPDAVPHPDQRSCQLHGSTRQCPGVRNISKQADCRPELSEHRQ
jgi:hypothetical protein